MGQELHCIATWNDRRSVGTASLVAYAAVGYWIAMVLTRRRFFR